LFGVPGTQFFQIRDRGFREAEGYARHAAISIRGAPLHPQATVLDRPLGP
jgi:hypothetical protein